MPAATSSGSARRPLGALWVMNWSMVTPKSGARALKPFIAPGVLTMPAPKQ